MEPRYPGRKSPSKLDDYELTLTSWLFRESRRHRKQRKTVKQLHSDLVQLGYTGSYDRVAAFARAWRQEQQEAKKTAARHTYVPLSFAPGEAFQFDWSEDYVVIGGFHCTCSAGLVAFWLRPTGFNKTGEKGSGRIG